MVRSWPRWCSTMLNRGFHSRCRRSGIHLVITWIANMDIQQDWPSSN